MCAFCSSYVSRVLEPELVSGVVRNVQRGVEGSDEDRISWRYRFTAMRLWGGMSCVFFTFNPSDIGTPLVLHFCNERGHRLERISLDATDEEMRLYYKNAMDGRSDIFHKMVAAQPRASALCFHETFKLAMVFLLAFATQVFYIAVPAPSCRSLC